MQLSKRRNCPACHGSDPISTGKKNGFEILICRACRTIFTGHVPSEAESENYDDYYGEANLSVPAFLIERVREIIQGFELHRKTNRLLDIGFGAGTILEVATEQNWVVYGLEVSRPAFEQARKRGFKVFHGTLVGANYPNDYFDVITASEILEHLFDPETELREMVRILRPGGLLWATTPSARSLSFRVLGNDWSVLSPPEHIQLYSMAGAAGMLRRAGFSDLKFRTLGLNPAEIINRFRAKGDRKVQGFDRVGSAYELNAALMKSPSRKLVKTLLNLGLDITRLGDSLKIFAKK